MASNGYETTKSHNQQRTIEPITEENENFSPNEKRSRKCKLIMDEACHLPKGVLSNAPLKAINFKSKDHSPMSGFPIDELY